MSDEKKGLDQWLQENNLAEKSSEAGGTEPSAKPAAVSVLEQVEKCLREDFEFKNITLDAVDHTARVKIRGEQTDIKVLFHYFPEFNLLTISCYFDMKIPEAKRDAVYLLSALRNARFRYGNDVVFSDCYVHRVSLWIQDDRLVNERFYHLTRSSFLTADEAFPLVMAVIYGGKTPAEVIAERDAKEAEKAEQNEHE